MQTKLQKKKKEEAKSKVYIVQQYALTINNPLLDDHCKSWVVIHKI